MAFMQWNESYSVKIESIDNQHKKLIDMINVFYEELKTNKSNEVLIKDLLTKMKLYTQMHFSTEEKLFKKHGFPAYETHIDEHRDFINRVTDIETRFNSGRMILSFEITSFLKDWLLKHVKCTDMQYADFLIKKGVQ